MQLADAVEKDIQRRQQERAQNQDSLSHQYDVTESRNKAFN